MPLLSGAGAIGVGAAAGGASRASGAEVTGEPAG
jgi:hypothetical protein